MSMDVEKTPGRAASVRGAESGLTARPATDAGIHVSSPQGRGGRPRHLCSSKALDELAALQHNNVMPNVIEPLITRIAFSSIMPGKLRRVLLRHTGIKIGIGSYIRQDCISTANRLIIGENVRIERSVYFDDHAGVEIMDGAVIASFCRILTRSHPIASGPVRQVRGQDIDLPVKIGVGCWLATGVTILPGVTVADGCVVGAGSVVTKSTAPNGLYIGVPAQRIRDLPTT
jgi:acetyltransferase-like isoleucine patch superfamily enzyme